MVRQAHPEPRTPNPEGRAYPQCGDHSPVVCPAKAGGPLFSLSVMLNSDRHPPRSNCWIRCAATAWWRRRYCAILPAREDGKTWAFRKRSSLSANENFMQFHQPIGVYNHHIAPGCDSGNININTARVQFEI
jgi:hypothetical protein